SASPSEFKRLVAAAGAQPSYCTLSRAPAKAPWCPKAVGPSAARAQRYDVQACAYFGSLHNEKESPMKITQIESRIVALPLEEPLADGPAAKDAKQTFVTLQMRTDEGVEG